MKETVMWFVVSAFYLLIFPVVLFGTVGTVLAIGWLLSMLIP